MFSVVGLSVVYISSMPNLLFVFFNSSIVLFSVSLIYQLLRKVLKSLTETVDLSISPCSVIFCFMYFEFVFLVNMYLGLLHPHDELTLLL